MDGLAEDLALAGALRADTISHPALGGKATLYLAHEVGVAVEKLESEMSSGSFKEDVLTHLTTGILKDRQVSIPFVVPGNLAIDKSTSMLLRASNEL
jgi:hypothetical protein